MLAGAWAVPVVALAAAAPSAAASGSASGEIRFSPSVYFPSSGLTNGVAGLVSPVGPLVLSLTYSPGFGGPATVAVSATTGSFSFTVRCPVGLVGGTVTASASGYPSVSAAMYTQSPSMNTGTVMFTYDSATATSGEEGGWVFPPIAGSVSVTAANILPSAVQFDYPTGYDGPPSATVDPVAGLQNVGRFSLSGVTATGAASTPATLTGSPADFQGIVTYRPAAATIALRLPSTG